MNKGTFRCVFGDHKYSEEATEDKEGYFVHMCIHCNLHGKYKNSLLEDEVYVEYYPNGYHKREVFSNGDEKIYYPNGKLKREVYKDGGEDHYNESGSWIYSKHCDSENEEAWFHKGEWVIKKPENWNPENG